MNKKLLTIDEVLRKELKDKDFKKYFAEEGKKLQIGFKIAQIRIKRGLTQKQLAKKIHTSQTAIARIERGEYLGYSLKTLEKVAAGTGTRLDIQFKT
ncbi:helix-turn-helix transcriptional regulator [bacterium]|nr:helix-turn-helix transcriptional regulator [bacterium]MBU3956360.1 helix-turn-helix transcriptional regulator [bacterium]